MIYLFNSIWYKLFGFPELYVVETEYAKLWNVDEFGMKIWLINKDKNIKIRQMTNSEIIKHGP